MGTEQRLDTKRQRNAAKKPNGNAKSVRQVNTEQPTDFTDGPDSAQSSLSQAELAVLKVFRTYLMGPGKMLCFDRSAVESFDRPIALLIDKGFLVAEKSKGRYSLTDTGFAAMKENGLGA